MRWALPQPGRGVEGTPGAAGKKAKSDEGGTAVLLLERPGDLRYWPCITRAGGELDVKRNFPTKEFVEKATQKKKEVTWGVWVPVPLGRRGKAKRSPKAVWSPQSPPPPCSCASECVPPQPHLPLPPQKTTEVHSGPAGDWWRRLLSISRHPRTPTALVTELLRFLGPPSRTLSFSTSPAARDAPQG